MPIYLFKYKTFKFHQFLNKFFFLLD